MKDRKDLSNQMKEILKVSSEEHLFHKDVWSMDWLACYLHPGSHGAHRWAAVPERSLGFRCLGDHRIPEQLTAILQTGPFVVVAFST